MLCRGKSNTVLDLSPGLRLQIRHGGAFASQGFVRAGEVYGGKSANFAHLSPDTAQCFMGAADLYGGKCSTLQHLPVTALYELARSTGPNPQTLRI